MVIEGQLAVFAIGLNDVLNILCGILLSLQI